MVAPRCLLLLSHSSRALADITALGMAGVCLATVLATTGCGAKAEAYPNGSTTAPSEVRQEAAAVPPAPDAVTECARLAPDDPYQENSAVAESAYVACRSAATHLPQDSAIVFAFAKSALWSDRVDEAATQFEIADEQLHVCGAAYYRGDEAWHRLDTAAAERFYARGRDCKDPKAVAQLYMPSVFSASAHPEIIEALATSDFQTLDRMNRVTVASYISGIYAALGEPYATDTFSTCYNRTYYKGAQVQRGLYAATIGDPRTIPEAFVYKHALPWVFRLLVPTQGWSSLEEFQSSESNAGRAELSRLAVAYKCGSYLPARVVASIEHFAARPEPLVVAAHRIAPSVHTLSDLTLWVTQQSSANPR